ncbi:MAG: molybdopterin-binding protein, partial [Candidatus Eremiobacteraeota bacterium]|nr:molybdopterin-binding protein [Candidatus Eremiobacteraeota bacterium]
MTHWHAALQAAGAVTPLPGEVVPLREAAGRLPAGVLRTLLPCPSYAAAAMDGYALRAARISAASPAMPLRLLIDADVFAVDTGAALPPDCDAVVPLENAHLDGVSVAFHACAEAGEHVRLPGEDVPPGVVVGALGRPLDGLECAALIACGASDVEVVCRPRVTIIPTGEELQPPGAAPVSGRVFDSNSTMIAQAARDLGASVTLVAIVKDDHESLRLALHSAAASSDAIFVLGGSSRGGRDVSHDALRAEGNVDVRGVATRPAKPVNLG